MEKRFKIMSEEGAQRYGAEVGTEVTIDIGVRDGEERAVVAAGWLEEVEEKKSRGGEK